MKEIIVKQTEQGREWTLKLSESEIAAIFGLCMSRVINQLDRNCPEKREYEQGVVIILGLGSDKDKRDLYDAIKKYPVVGQIAQQIGLQLMSLGASTSIGDLEEILGVPLSAKRNEQTADRGNITGV